MAEAVGGPFFVIRIYDPLGEHDTVHAGPYDTYADALLAVEILEAETLGRAEAVVEHVYDNVDQALARHFNGTD